MDVLDAVLDEVALEGLDGVTLGALWTRMRARQPAFTLPLDARTQERLWRVLLSNADVTPYLLPHARPPIRVHDRFLEVDPETGIQEVRRPRAEEREEDVYPVSVVLDDPAGIQGSCLSYKERQDISSLVRGPDMSPILTLEEAQSRWGERLVLVASQELRYRTLIGCEGNPELKLNDYSYCILERLGRARWQGELQRDLHTYCFKMDAGKVHYLRKCLDRNGLITMQSHVVRLPSGSQQHSILLLLKRFHVDRRSKYDILMESMSNILSALPNKIGIMIKLRDQLHICEHTFKRLYQYMQAAKLVSVLTVPLQQLSPDAGPCKTKRGTDIRVRCLKLLKPYTPKVVVVVEEEDDENDEEGEVPSQRNDLAQPRDVERDTLAQAYEIVVKAGSQGISQTELRRRLNIGKLESRMICRNLDRNLMIKGFMQDEGRQRTTKFVSKLFVETSSLNLQFTKERERSEKLRLPQGSRAPPPPEAQPRATAEGRAEERPAEEEEQVTGQKGKVKASKKSKPSTPRHSTPLSKKQKKVCESTQKGTLKSELSGVERALDSPHTTGHTPNHAPSPAQDQSEKADERTGLVEVLSQGEHNQSRRKGGEHQETYRILKRRNIIIEAVRNLKIVEGIYTLQKKLIDEEKQEGVSTRVCKKSVLRLASSLAREGYLKLYKTTVIQDGISKKVEFVVHPSIAPDDPLVRSAIEQVRFRISSSYTVHRMKREEDKAKPVKAEAVKVEPKSSSKGGHAKTQEKMGFKALKNFKPSIVPGLSRALGFQPKMPRIRLVHTFLWYLIYGEPSNRQPPSDPTATVLPSDPEVSQPPSDPTATVLPSDPEVSQPPSDPTATVLPSDSEVSPAAPDTVTSSSAKEEAEGDAFLPPEEEQQFTVYVDELDWKRFVPPLPVHREFGYGWALISDVLISLPLSVYVKVIQINYKVDGLDEYLSDPVKQHYLVRFLPSNIKTQLLHRRKYFFSFYESLQKLCYMGLIQFGPTEKFMDKDQGFVYLKKHMTIVDTTACEPHYNLTVETHPFERRHYTFNTAQDVENYWFDLMCVCLNTPLGVIRQRFREGETEGEEPELPVGPERYERLQYTLKGSCDAVDDGVIPGDGRGAGGLDSSLFSHLKRNWIWTTYPVSKPRKPGGSHAVRLRKLLSKHPSPSTVCAGLKGGVGGSTLTPPAVLEEEVVTGMEPKSRNQQVRGGKRLKRKRQKKETSKPPKRKRKVVSVRKQSLCQDETDRKALLRMTRQRVTWTHLEDSILMLCRVASHFLNRKIKRPFVLWNVVRDVLHAELEYSQDKTSLSVGRRSRYIMKNPQTHLNYRICLAEVYQDKALVDEFMNRKNNYEDPQVCAEEFKEFLRALRLKFSSSYGFSDVIIPDTREELFNKFKVYVIGDGPMTIGQDVLNSVDDIHSLVLSNLIQSTLALSNSQMKTCQSFQCFSLYSRYRQKVLLQVFLTLKNRGLVNRRRVTHGVAPKKNRAVPFLPMSYQLSQHYYRYFTWRFPSSMYNEVYGLVEELCVRGKTDRSNTFCFQTGRDGEEAAGGDEGQGRGDEAEAEEDGGKEEEKPPQRCGGEAPAPPADEEDMVTFPIDATGGVSLCCLSLLSLGLISLHVSIPQQIVVVDSTMVDNEVVKSITKELDEEEDEEGGVGRVEVKAHQASHTNYLLMKGFFIPGIISHRNTHSTEHIAVNSCTIRVQLRTTPSHTLFSECESAMSVVSRSSVPALPSYFTRVFGHRVCVRSYEERCVDVLGYSAADVEAVRALRAAVESKAEYGIDRLELCRSHAHLEEAEHGRSRTLQQYVEDLLELEELVEVGALSPRLVCVSVAAPWLLHSSTQVCEKAPPTSSHRPVKRGLSPTRPQEGGAEPPAKRAALEPCATETARTEAVGMETAIMEAVKERDADKVGVAKSSPTHEAGDTSTSHVTHVTEPAEQKSQDPAIGDKGDAENSDVQREQSFVSRPWRIVDGSLNQSVCKGMLDALLLHLMTHPGVTEAALLLHYCEVLQPIVILDLLEALVQLGCVTRRFMVSGPKSSLFSRPSTPQVKGRGQVSVTQNPVAFYEPTVDCSLRLAQVFPHESNWNKWVQLSGR